MQFITRWVPPERDTKKTSKVTHKRVNSTIDGARRPKERRRQQQINSNKKQSMKAWNSNINCAFGFLFRCCACMCVLGLVTVLFIYLFLKFGFPLLLLFLVIVSVPCVSVSFAPIINVCGMRILLKKVNHSQPKTDTNRMYIVYSSRVCA